MANDSPIGGQFRLNVGGVIFPMESDSLDGEPDSMLASMFSPACQCQPSEKDGNGAFLIHRSPKMFGYIHRHLHAEPLELKDLNLHGLNELLQECDFYQTSRLKCIVTKVRDAANEETERVRRIDELQVDFPFLNQRQDQGTKEVRFRSLLDDITSGRGRLGYTPVLEDAEWPRNAFKDWLQENWEEEHPGKGRGKGFP